MTKYESTPKDTGSERAVLSGICQHGLDAFVDISDLVSTKTFTSNINEIIFKCLQTFFEEGQNQSIDVPSLLSAAHTLGLETVLNEPKHLEYLDALFSYPIKLENVRQHAARIMKLQIARLAQEKHKEAWKNLSEVKGNENIDSILGMSEKPIFDLITELNQGKQDTEQIAEGGQELLTELFDNPMENIGIPTPYAMFNEAIGGGLRTGVTLIGARIKTGKTTLATNVALHVAKCGIPVLCLDTEMSKHDIYFKCLSNLSDIPYREIESGKAGNSYDLRNKIFDKNKELEKLPYSYRRIAGKEFEEILSIIRRWIWKRVGFENGKPRPHLVIYDYFKLMSVKSLADLQEYQAMGFQVSALSDFCGEYDTSCLAFVQLNRDGITRETSDVISQSDRLGWTCTSISIFKNKADEEIVEDGNQNGNKKLIPIDCRYGISMSADSDYINMKMDGAYAKIEEISTKKNPLPEKDIGLEIDDSPF